MHFLEKENMDHTEKAIQEFYFYDDNIKKSICKVNNCNQRFAGQTTGLYKHIIKRHADIYKSLVKKVATNSGDGTSETNTSEEQNTIHATELDTAVQNLENISNRELNHKRLHDEEKDESQYSDSIKSSNKKRKPTNTKVQSPDKKVKSSIKKTKEERRTVLNSRSNGNSNIFVMTPDYVQNACAELVLLNERSFALLDDSGFRKIIDPLLGGIIVDSTTMKQHVNKIAQEKRHMLKDELKGKFLSLKIDTVNSQNKDILGVSVQYIQENKIVIRTLAVEEIKADPTPCFVLTIILRIFEQYDLQIKHIYSFTVDNGKNSTKFTLNDYKCCKNNEETEEIKCNKLKMAALENVYRALLSKQESCPILQKLPCIANSLKSAIEDTLQEITSKIFVEAMQVSEQLQTQSLLNILNKMEIKNSNINCTGKWFSGLDLFERLPVIKVLSENLKMSVPGLNHFSPYEWKEIDLMISVLKLAKMTATRFEDTHIMAGDFLKLWSQLKSDIEKINSLFAKKFVNNMTVREKCFIENELFLSSVFLDPRYKQMLNESQVIIAKKHLFCIYQSIKILTANQNSKEPCSPLREEDAQQKLQNGERCFQNENDSFEIQINTYWQESELNQTDCIIEYWNSKKDQYTDLYLVAMNILHIPTTRLTTKRVFSALNFILSSDSSDLNEKLLNDTLFCRLNKFFI